MTDARRIYAEAWAGPVVGELALIVAEAAETSRLADERRALVSAAVDHATVQVEAATDPEAAEAFRHQLEILEQGIPEGAA